MIKLTFATEIRSESNDFELIDSDCHAEDLTFKELIELIEDNYLYNSSSFGDFDKNTWLSGAPIENRDYFEKGHHKTYSLHFNDDLKKEKYWIKALNHTQGG